MVLSALLDAAHMLVGTAALLAAAPMLAGTAALMACIVLPLLLTAHMLSIISTGLLPKLRKISFIPYFNNLL